MNLSSMRIGKREHNKQLNNKGFSLVELIVTVSIMVVLVGGLSLGTSLLFSQDAQKIAGMIDNELSDARMLSMTREGTYTLTLHLKSGKTKDNKITIEDSNSSISPIETYLDKNVSIEVTNSDGSYSKSGDVDVAIVFDKGNGSVKTIDGGSASGVYIITVKSGSGSLEKTAVVNLVSVTGRHYIDK